MVAVSFCGGCSRDPLNYEIERGQHWQPEIKGYSQEYLEASSPRRAQIKEYLHDIGRDGAGAAQVAAHPREIVKTCSREGVSINTFHKCIVRHSRSGDARRELVLVG